MSNNISNIWQIGRTVDKNIYYYNKITKKSQWNIPNELLKKIKCTIPNKYKNIWQIGCTVDKNIYYYNKITKKSQWNIPDELLKIRKIKFDIIDNDI